MIYKICTQCLKEKDETHFNKHKLGKFGLNPVCRTCRTERQRKHRDKVGYGSTLKSKYGLTLEQFHQMIQDQKGLCYICNEELTLNDMGAKCACVDHDHYTGKVRKILCRNCNTALGHVKENTDILYAMIRYLDEH